MDVFVKIKGFCMCYGKYFIPAPWVSNVFFSIVGLKINNLKFATSTAQLPWSIFQNMYIKHNKKPAGIEPIASWDWYIYLHLVYFSGKKM